VCTAATPPPQTAGTWRAAAASFVDLHSSTTVPKQFYVAMCQPADCVVLITLQLHTYVTSEAVIAAEATNMPANAVTAKPHDTPTST